MHAGRRAGGRAGRNGNRSSSRVPYVNLHMLAVTRRRSTRSRAIVCARLFHDEFRRISSSRRPAVAKPCARSRVARTSHSEVIPRLSSPPPSSSPVRKISTGAAASSTAEIFDSRDFRSTYGAATRRPTRSTERYLPDVSDGSPVRN